MQLPVQAGEREHAVSRREELLRGRAVLIVDDNAAHRRLLGKALERQHIRPTLTTNTKTALRELKVAHAAGRAFDVVLLDAQMPELDGFALAARLRDDARHRGLPVVLMLSSADLVGEVARCRALGVAAYLRKPLRQADLLRTLSSVIAA